MRVVVADDAMIVREGLARLLTEAGFDIVGQAADADELLRQVQSTQPDVAVINIRMPPTYTDEGLQAAHAIRSTYPAVGILVLSQYVSPSYAIELLSAGRASATSSRTGSPTSRSSLPASDGSAKGVPFSTRRSSPSSSNAHAPAAARSTS